MPPLIARLLKRASASSNNSMTPAPAPALPAMAHEDFLHEEQITNAKLLALYKRAFMDVQSLAVGDRLAVMTESRVRLLVQVDAERRLIFFTAYFGLRADASLSDKLALAHRANDKLVLARYTVLDDTTLYADYQLPYEGGLPAALVVGLTRRLGQVMRQAVSEQDESGVAG